MNFVMNRNITVKSLSGHALAFKKGVPQHVPPEMVEEVMARGGLPESGEMPEHHEQPTKIEPVGPARKERLFQIFQELVTENRRGTFSAANVPRIGPVRNAFGFDIDAREMKAAWAEFRSETARQAQGLDD